MVTNSNLTRFGLTTFWKSATLSRNYAWMNLNQFKLQKYFDRFFRYLEYDTSLLYSHNNVLFRNNKIYINLKLVDTSILPYRRILDDFNWLNRRKNKIRTFRYFKLSVARLKGFRKVRKRYGLVYKLNSAFFFNPHGLKFFRSNKLKSNLNKLARVERITDMFHTPLKVTKSSVLCANNELRALSNLNTVRSTKFGKMILNSLFFNRLFLRSKFYRNHKIFANFDRLKTSSHLTQKFFIASFKRKRRRRFYRYKLRKFMFNLTRKIKLSTAVKKSLLRRVKFKPAKNLENFSRLFPFAKSVAGTDSNFINYLNLVPRSQLKPIYNFYHNPSLKLTTFSANKLEDIFAKYFFTFLKNRFRKSRLIRQQHFIYRNFIKKRLFNFLPRVTLKITKARILKRKFFRNWKIKNSRKNFKKPVSRTFNKNFKKPFYRFTRKNNFRNHFVDYEKKLRTNVARFTKLFPQISDSTLFRTTVLTAMLRRPNRRRLPFWLIKKRSNRTKHLSSTKVDLKYRLDNSFNRIIVKLRNSTLNKSVTYNKVVNFKNFYYLLRKSIFLENNSYLFNAFNSKGTNSSQFFNKRLLKIEQLNKKFSISASIEANVFGGKIIPTLEVARFKKNRLENLFFYVLRRKISKFWLKENKREYIKVNNNLRRYNTAFGLEDRRFKFNKFKKNKRFFKNPDFKKNKFNFRNFKKPFKNNFYNSGKFVNKNNKFFKRNFNYEKNAKKNNFESQQNSFYQNKQKNYYQKNSSYQKNKKQGPEFKKFQFSSNQIYNKKKNSFKKKGFAKKN